MKPELMSQREQPQAEAEGAGLPALVRVLMTGATGFLGRNLLLEFGQRPHVEVVLFQPGDSVERLAQHLASIDVVVHVAEVHRDRNPLEFISDRLGATQLLCEAMARATHLSGRPLAVIHASSREATRDTHRGHCHREAELALHDVARDRPIELHIFRLPEVFGKGSTLQDPGVVASFCHHVGHELPLPAHDAAEPLTLVHIEDVVRCFVAIVEGSAVIRDADGFAVAGPQHGATVGEVAGQILGFRGSRDTVLSAGDDAHLTRALYATYLSLLPPEAFAYPVPLQPDRQGVFVEMIRTSSAGQFAFFTTVPGATRGGHHHHGKSEKFMVAKGSALFRFRHVFTGERHLLTTSGADALIIETVPGWTHDITNIGTDDLVVLLWGDEAAKPPN